jgi:hypothetical protein
MSSKRDDLLFELEQRLAQVGRRLSAEEASSLIAEDFVEFGASGKVWSKAEIIAADVLLKRVPCLAFSKEKDDEPTYSLPKCSVIDLAPL